MTTQFHQMLKFFGGMGVVLWEVGFDSLDFGGDDVEPSDDLVRTDLDDLESHVGLIVVAKPGGLHREH